MDKTKIASHRLSALETGRLSLRFFSSGLGRRDFLFKIFEEMSKINADRLSFGAGPVKCLYLKDPDDIGQVLTAPTDIIGHSRYQAGPVGLRNSRSKIVTNAEGEEWKRKRRQMAGYMGTKGLKSGYVAEAEGLISNHIKGWQNLPSIGVAQEASRLALKYMFKSSFNLTLSNEACDRLHDAAQTLHGYLFWSVVSLGVVPKPIVKSLTRVDTTIDVYDDLINQVTEQFRISSDEERQKSMMHGLFSSDEMKEILAGNTSLVKCAVSEMIVAGHFSVRTAFYWAMHDLADAPDYQDKIYSERNSHSKRSYGLDKNGNMPAASMATLESLRLHPPFYIFLKETKKDFDGKNGLYIPKGTTITIPPWAVHRNAEFYPNPEKFDPDTHFAPHAMRNRSRFAYLPFGQGPHNCPGQGLTLQQISGTLSEIYSRYKLQRIDDQTSAPPVTSDVFLNTEDHSRLKVYPR